MVIVLSQFVLGFLRRFLGLGPAPQSPKKGVSGTLPIYDKDGVQVFGGESTKSAKNS